MEAAEELSPDGDTPVTHDFRQIEKDANQLEFLHDTLLHGIDNHTRSTRYR